MPETAQAQTALPDPQSGGSYTRCPDTGELTPVQVPAEPGAEQPTEQPAAPAAASAQE